MKMEYSLLGAKMPSELIVDPGMGLSMFIMQYPAVMLLIVSLLFSLAGVLIIYILRANKEKDELHIELENTKKQQQEDRVQVLENLVVESSNSMQKAVGQVRDITEELGSRIEKMSNDLHGRVTELSTAFHKLQGEHHSNMATCPLRCGSYDTAKVREHLEKRETVGRRYYDDHPLFDLHGPQRED